MGYRSTLLIVIVVFGILFSLLYAANAVPDRQKVAIVIIPEGSSIPDSEHNNFEPAVITVVIGVNNTVRWINEDSTFHNFSADDRSDPDFWNTTYYRPLLAPGDRFEFTFTKPGEHGYHGEPHPHMRGTVIVLESEK